MTLTSAVGEYSAERPVGARAPFGRRPVGEPRELCASRALSERVSAGERGAAQGALTRPDRDGQGVARGGNGRTKAPAKAHGGGTARSTSTVVRSSASGAPGCRNRNRWPLTPPVVSARPPAEGDPGGTHRSGVGAEPGPAAERPSVLGRPVALGRRERHCLLCGHPGPGDVRKSPVRKALGTAADATGPHGDSGRSAGTGGRAEPPAASAQARSLAVRRAGRARPRCSRRVPPG